MTVKLSRLPSKWQEMPPELFQRYYNDAMDAIEVSLNAILDIPGIQDAIDAATAAAAAANTAADNAQNATDTQSSEASLINSGVENIVSPPILSADAAGAITVSTHDRRYGNPSLNPTVTVTGGVISTAFVAGDLVYVYYDDASRAGGAVTYHTSLNSANAVQGGNRHSVGAVEIPVVGTNDGKGVRPPGVVEV